MTNKYMYFIANWKMFSDGRAIKSLDKVIKFAKTTKNNRSKLIYCPPYTLLDKFSKKLKNSRIMIGAQNCHHEINFGPFTGSINAQMIKQVGCKYVIIGHSENRQAGEDDYLINKKIKAALASKLQVIFCIGESNTERKKNKTNSVLKSQILNGLKGLKNIKDIIFSYEPIWSIGTGIIPSSKELEKTVKQTRKFLSEKFNLKNLIILYGGSINPENVIKLKKIDIIDGFLIGGASQDAKKFIAIVKKTLI
jgi:triosephosphate isomerase